MGNINILGNVHVIRNINQLRSHELTMALECVKFLAICFVTVVVSMPVAEIPLVFACHRQDETTDKTFVCQMDDHDTLHGTEFVVSHRLPPSIVRLQIRGWMNEYTLKVDADTSLVEIILSGTPDCSRIFLPPRCSH